MVNEQEEQVLAVIWVAQMTVTASTDLMAHNGLEALETSRFKHHHSDKSILRYFYIIAHLQIIKVVQKRSFCKDITNSITINDNLIVHY